VLGSSSSGIRYNILVSSGVMKARSHIRWALIVGDAAQQWCGGMLLLQVINSFTTGNAGEYLLTLNRRERPVYIFRPQCGFTKQLVVTVAWGKPAACLDLDAHRTYYVKLSNPLSSRG